MNSKAFLFIGIIMLIRFQQAHAQLPFIEGFETGSFTAGSWNLSGTASISTLAPASGIYCMKGDATWGINKTFAGTLPQDSLVLSFKIKASQTNTTSAIFRIKDTTTSGTCAGLFFDASGTIKATDGTSSIVLMSYDTAVWYHVRMVLNLITKQYDIWIDQSLKANDFGFYTTTFTKPYIFSWSSVAATGTAWLDDIKIEGDVIPMTLNDEVEPKITIYPNPADHLVYIHSTSSHSIILYGLNHQKILARKINLGVNVLDIKLLSSGIYLLQAFDEKGKQQFSQSILKN